MIVLGVSVPCTSTCSEFAQIKAASMTIARGSASISNVNTRLEGHFGALPLNIDMTSLKHSAIV